MHAVKFGGPRQLSIEEVARPAAAERGDAVVRVTTAAIGPLDLERYGGPDPWPTVTPGGACAGVIESVGRDVRRWRLDDVVLVPSAVRPADRFSAGPDEVGPEELGAAGGRAGQLVLGRDIDGSLAGWVRVPAADLNLVAIPDPLNLEAQVVVAAETYATGARAAGILAQVRPATIAVIGCDPSALAFISAWMTAKRFGSRIVASDASAGRVLFARRLGAIGVVDRGDDTAGDAIRRAGECDRFDAVVVGTRIEGAALDVAMELAKPDGVVVTLDPPGVGWSATGQAPAKPAGFPGVDELKAHILAIRDGALDLLPLVSHTFPLAEAASAFESALGRQRGVLKVLLKP